MDAGSEWVNRQLERALRRDGIPAPAVGGGALTGETSSSADFWATIDATRPPDAGPAAHAETLVETLVGRGLEPTLAFGRAFDEAMAALNRWDLWGAAYYVLQGCGDDAFEYLRAWIVGRGEASWRRAASDPEGWLVEVLDGASDPWERLEEVGAEDGEHLLYAAGLAHERLTGSWRPPRAADLPTEPAGEEWDEEDLPSLFPRLTAALPAGWWEMDDGDFDVGATLDLDAVFGPDLADVSCPPASGRSPSVVAAAFGITAFTQGNHERAMSLLVPLFEDPEAWGEVSASEFGADAAYIVGIGRLTAGDPDGAADALKQALDPDDPRPDIRRALAQVELARGELEAAATLLDRSPGAKRMDRALAVTLAFRRGDHGAAGAAAIAMLEDPPSPFEHPWEVAGAFVQAALVLVELGDAKSVALAADRIDALIEDAPPSLPLVVHAILVRGGALRLDGRLAEAEALLADRVENLDASDRGQALLELARVAASDGREQLAAERYELAAESFDRAGERWMAAHVRSEEAEH